ncbi:MAG: ATP-binding protein [Thermoplasmata archaeon]|nr:MAG: ATP-binding protein [Thermoplasmata archaeon]
MLVELSVENYLSIKDRITFSMEPTTDKKLKGNIFSFQEKHLPDLLKVAAVYGANASGKSNFLSAFNFLSRFVMNSHLLPPGMKIPVTPFKLDPDMVKEPTSFEIIYINKGIKYRYGVSLTRERVVEEYLYSYRTRKPTLIFERTNTDEYRFTNDIHFQEDIRKKTKMNTLYLSTSSQWNYEPSNEALKWFGEHLIVGPPVLMFEWMERTCEMIKRDSNLKELILKTLKNADLGIMGLEVSKEEKSDYMNNLNSIINEMQIINMVFKGSSRKSIFSRYDIKFAHKGVKNGIDTTVHFGMEEESGGTRRLFQVIGRIIESLQKGGTIIMDEFETSIHPLLLKKIVTMFLDDEINRNGAQLIFATHSTSLLDRDLFRRDQIWFTEKKGDGSTDLYSLADFDVRKDANFEKGYLQGRYGAIPYLPAENLL